MHDTVLVFIIDDNPVERVLLSSLLEKVRHWKVRCIQCATGDDAVRHLSHGMPQVVFVDYRLVGEKGSDVMHRLRAAGCRAGFVLFTGTSGEEALIEALRAGADDYLHKTDICLETVSRVLHHALEKAKAGYALMETMDALQRAKEALENRVEARTIQLQETQEQLDTITSVTHDPIIVLDHDARVTFWNPAAEKIFGYRSEEILGQEFFCLLPPSDFKTRMVESYQVLLQTSLEGTEDAIREFKAVRKGGTVFPVAASISPIQRPGGWHAVIIPREITRQQEAEAALRRAKEEAEQAIRLKDQFVSLVAHDLRGPFTTILGFLDLLENDKKNPLDKKQKECLRWIVHSSQKMMRMIDEILSIGRLKAGKITPKAKFVNARFLGTTVMEMVAPMAEQKGVQLENAIDKNNRLYVDPDLLGEVLHNLLTNAVKFCRHGDRVTLFCPQEESSTLAVQDNGVGIPKKLQTKIFCLEEKVSTVGTAGEYGTGFGLPFSQELMRAHGGLLSVESKEGKGSTFFARLPEVIPQVLVVDDDEVARMLLIHRLRSERVVITEAETGLEALRLVAGREFHLIISDVQMPGMDGFELLKALRNNPETKTIPTILITGDSAVSTREKAFQLGADDFITKQFAYPDFLPRVRRFLG